MMRSLIFSVVILLFSATGAEAGQTRVRGHTTRRGTYVGPHHRTNPDRSKSNNWSTKGNFNPYTGKEGTKSP